MGFASGFTAGLFGSVDRALREEFSTAKAETARLTSLRQARTAQRNDAREAKVEKANEEIQALAGKIGPGSGIILNDFIQQGGLAYAKEATTKLLNYTQKTGITPVQFYKLTEEELGKKPNAQFFNTLAQSAVPAVKPLGEPVTTAGGIAEYFGYGGPEVVKKKTEAGLSSTGGRSIRDISGLTEVRGGITDTAIPVEFGFNAQKEMAARRVVNLMEEINNPNISSENKLKLQEELKAANATLDGIRKVEATMAPDKSFEDQYRRAIAEGDTKGAQAILDAATKYHMGTTTPKYQGNTGAFTLKMIDRARKLVDDEIGFDPRNPDKTVSRRMKQSDGSFKLVPVPGEEMQKIRKTKQLQTFLNLRNRLLPKGNDFNSITALDDLDAEIKILREQLEEGNTGTGTATGTATGTGTGTGTNTGTAPKKRSVVLNKNTFVKTLRKIENDPSIPTDEKESTVIQIFSASGYSNEEIKKVVEEIKKEQASGLDPSFTKNKLTAEEINKTMGDGPRRDKQGLVPRRERFGALLEGRRNPLGGTEYDKMGPQT